MASPTMLRDVGAVASTSDPQVTALLDGNFHWFDQWKSGREVNRRSKLMRLRLTLDHLLTRMLGARDYAGAAQVLSVMYHRFMLIPSRCVQASLEILQRHPQHHKEELMQFYQSALQNGRLDQVIVYKEMLMLHIVSGDYYEAYHLFKGDMQELDVHHDAHLQGTFGMVCYWLLFIESDELRGRFIEEGDSHHNLPDNDDDESDMWNPFERSRWQSHQSRDRPTVAASSALELVNSRYMYKTAIGVHILYQEAVTALRRAIAVSPESVVFLEFYAQLLTLAGDTDRACDLLEHFYYLHPTDPHAARLLANYLEAHFPESADARVDIYARWLQNDPSSSEALRKLLEQSNEFLSRERLLMVLASAIDVMGGDLHLAQAPENVLQLYRAFNQVVQACRVDGESQDADPGSAALLAIRASRQWWLSSYLSRPATPDQVIAFISFNEVFHEVVVVKAVLAYHLFNEDGLTIARAVHTLSLTSPSALNAGCMKEFRWAFRSLVAHNLFLTVSAPATSNTYITKSASAHPSVPVLNRSLLVKDTSHAKRSRTEIIHLEDETAAVNQALVRALEEAVRVEQADGQPKYGPGERSFENMINGLLFSNGESTVSTPLYADILEELLYRQTKASSPHVQEQLNAHLRAAGVTIPSWLEVREVFRYLQERWSTNEAQFGHAGLLLRYEAFLTRYMRKQAKSSQYWVGGVTAANVHDALQEMKLHVSRSHVHFPQFDEAAKWMQIKARRFLRLRRRLLRDYMLAMRFVAYESEHVETRNLVYAAMRVAAQHFHSDLLTVDDLRRQATIVLVNRYAFIVRNMKPTYRQFLETYVRVGRVCDPVETLAALKRRYFRMKRVTLGDVQAFLWIRQWEAENPGQYRDLIEDKDDDEQ